MRDHNMVGWIESFFSQGNSWELDKIMKGEGEGEGEGYPAELQLQLEVLVRPALQDRFPVILPRLTDDKELLFYVLTDNSRQLEEIKNIVKAWLGQVHVKIDPRIYKNSIDSIEATVLDRVPHGFIKLHIPFKLNTNKPLVYEVMHTLSKLVEQYNKRPLIYAAVQRPTGRILRDFFIACSHKKGDEANEYYQELKAHHKLTSRNLLSIEIQALEAANKWQSIIDHQRLPDIINGGIPSYIVETLLETINKTILFSTSPSDYVLARLQSDLLFLSGLFLRPIDIAKTTQQIGTWKIWAIGAAALGYAKVFEIVPVEVIDSEWLSELELWAGFSGTPSIEINEKISTLDILIESEPSFEIVIELLKLSIMATTNDGISIYQCLLSYPDNIINDISNNGVLYSLLTSLNERCGEQKAIRSWQDWLTELLTNSNPKSLLQIAIEQNNEWKIDGWSEEKVFSLLEQLSNHDNAIVFRDVIPILQRWLCNAGVLLSSKFVEQILLILASDDEFSTQDLILMSDLINSLISVSHTALQYDDALECLDLCWGKVGSIRSLDDILETIDVLLDSICANVQARMNLWNNIQVFCISNWQRLSEQQRIIVIQFAKEITSSSEQFPVLENQKIDDIDKINLTGKRLAIYTLTETAGRRAKSIFSQLFPELDVQLNHDHSATSALLNLASTADYFIFSSKSAAHQAFYPVTKKRNDILYPDGKGSSSIVRTFVAALAE